MEVKLNRQTVDVTNTVDIAHGLRITDPQFYEDWMWPHLQVEVKEKEPTQEMFSHLNTERDLFSETLWLLLPETTSAIPTVSRVRYRTQR